jgi:protease-4
MSEYTEQFGSRHGISHIDQYFGLWAIEEKRFMMLVDSFRTMDIVKHVTSQAPVTLEQRTGFQTQNSGSGNIALVEMVGTMTKYGSSMGEGISTIGIRRAIRSAARDPEISGIMLRIDSPGGTVAGTKDLADEIANARQSKPVYAYIEDMGASGAYYVASQASKIYANDSALIGSIGTFAVLTDTSKMAEDMGVKVHVVRSGSFKGVGTPGTEITEEHIGEMQTIVDEFNSQFLQSVSKGRNLSIEKVEALADGRVHMAAKAKELMLIDSISSFEKAVNDMAAERKANMSNDNAQASGETDVKTVEPATFAEIKEACPGASSDFICGQLEANATTEQARNAFMKEQNERIRVSEEKNIKQQEEIAQIKASKEKGGQDELTGNSNNGNASNNVDLGDPKAAYNALIEDQISQGISKKVAIRNIATKEEYEDVYQAFLNANVITNRRH